MRTILITLLAFLLEQAGARSQQISISMNNTKATKATLWALNGEKTTFIDSVALSGENCTFQFPSGHPQGMYRVFFENSRWVDFLNSPENIEMVTDARSPAESLKVIRSSDNILYYDFLRLSKQYKLKTDILQLVLARYPHDDPYYTTTLNTVTTLQQRYVEFVDKTSQRVPSSFVARYIRSSRLPVIDYALPVDQQLKFLKEHALDNVDFSDEGLIHSDVFSNKTIEYLTYYRNPQLPKELLEREFNTAIDTLLNKAKMNTTVYQHITEYLIDGFKKFGFEKCIEYILDNYVIKDNLCLDEKLGDSVQKMIEQKKKLPVGAPVPDITLPDTAGNLVPLSSVQGEIILILFYSTSCPHCKEMIPKLSGLYTEKKASGIEVYAVSMDQNKQEWLDFINRNNLRWVNVNNPQGWSGEVIESYSVYATPTMFLIDKEKKIIGKPITFEELQRLW